MFGIEMNGLRKVAVVIVAGGLATGCAQVADVMKSTASTLDQTIGQTMRENSPGYEPSSTMSQMGQAQPMVMSQQQIAAQGGQTAVGSVSDPRVEMMQQQLMILAKEVGSLKKEVMSSVAGEQRLAQIDREILMMRGRLGINPELEEKGRQRSEEVNAEIVQRIKENETFLKKQQEILEQQASMIQSSEQRLTELNSQGDAIQQQAQATQQMMAQQVAQQAQIAQQQKLQSQVQQQQIMQGANGARYAQDPNMQVRQPMAVQPQSAQATMAPKALAPSQAQPSQVAMASSSDDFGMHIASYKKISQAQAAWKDFRQAYPFMMKDMKPLVAKVNFNDGRGDFYRLIAGPKSEKSSANDDCKIIKVNSGYCSVVSYEGASLY